ncbi:DUF3237 domain-containing protein [Pseudomonas sp. BGr12]|uniref:DUF3237 domain-containing protein n=1 Tax=Pseudomonas sp. BGr12 TaxID=2936269 RepID=UPI002559D905|nr:DUF3237 domain-containing protein [Pseudomonas sp. BJa5]MDL2431361.1 DUF3237 domain-containing protein [Pseudomonas sp. BJa5]
MSEPGLHPTLHLDVEIGDELLRGATAQGRRIDYPILGGRFTGSNPDGKGFAGCIPPGGADYYLERHDGCGELDARYSLLCNDGTLIEVHNTGLLVLSEAGVQLAAQHWPIDPQHYRCHCAPRFHSKDARYAWMSRHLFVGQVSYPAANCVQIECFRIH